MSTNHVIEFRGTCKPLPLDLIEQPINARAGTTPPPMPMRGQSAVRPTPAHGEPAGTIRTRVLKRLQRIDWGYLWPVIAGVVAAAIAWGVKLVVAQ